MTEAHGTNVEKLVRMANQIATNFDYGDQGKAVAGMLEHVSMYWTLDMKRAIIEYSQGSGGGLSKIAGEVVTRLADKYGETA